MDDPICKRVGCKHPASEHKGCLIKAEGQSGTECNRAGCKCTELQ